METVSPDQTSNSGLLSKTEVVMILILSAISALSGFLFSKASFAGRTGIHLFYKEYRFLRTWWKGATVMLALLLVLFLLQGWIHRKLPATKSKIVQTVLLLLAMAGIYFTYLDFTSTPTHRLLGEKFHLGAYLFWIAWMIISIYYLLKKETTASTVS